MLINNNHLAELLSPVQTINARVELHNGSTLAQICTCQDYLSNLTIERVGGSKFFGYGICHKLIANFIDTERALNLTNIDFMEVTFGVNGEFIYPFPAFQIEEVERDETTNEIKVVAYDRLYKAHSYSVSELALPSSYSILYFTAACAALLGLSVKFENVRDITNFHITFEAGANFDGSETVRQALDAIAEAPNTIYYLNGNWELTFKQLDITGEALTTIGKEQYIELTTGANCKLTAITHTTELGDSITASIGEDGVTQFLRDNPFLELRNDTGAILDDSIAMIGGLTINPFECSWVGNYLLEIGDKIAIVAENDTQITTFIVDDSITFDGTLSQYSRWEFAPDDAETAGNPTSLGEALNKTFARVDKVNKRIELMAGDVSAQQEKLAKIELTTDSINATVTNVQKALTITQTDVNGLKTTTTSQGERIGALEVTSESISLQVAEHEEKITAFEELETGQFIDRVAQIELELDSIESTVSEAVTTVEGIETRVEAAETAIAQTKEEIALSATKEELNSVNNDVTANATAIGALQINADSINASVKSVEESFKGQVDSINNEIAALTKEASLKMTEEEVKIAIDTELSNGVDKVTTSTGFTFNSEGLTIDKQDSEMKTQITEDGMTVYRNDEAVLVASNKGVDAVNLNATTYLIIGGRSRFENYDRSGEDRVACFWIGN